MSDDNVTPIEDAPSKKAQAKKKAAIQEKKQLKNDRAALEMQLLNMRQMYEGKVQVEGQLNQVIGELRTIIGAILVACEKEELMVTAATLQELNARYAGYEMNVVGDGELFIQMIEVEDEEDA